MRAKAYVDGRGNAGEEGACAVHMIGKNLDQRIAIPLGSVTNNEAEYEAVILAMRLALQSEIDDLVVLTDSLLIFRQFHGFYKLNKPHLAPLLACVNRLSAKFQSFHLQWVPRSETEVPDSLCRDLFRR